MPLWQMALIFGLPAALLAYRYGLRDAGEEVRPAYVPLLALMAVGGLSLAWRNPIPQADFAYRLLFLAWLVPVGLICRQTWIVPNLLTVPGIVLGLLASPAQGSHPWPGADLGWSALGLSAGLVGFQLISMVPNGAMGGGCVKLAGMIGAFLGPEFAFAAFMLSFMAPVPLAIPRLWKTRDPHEPFEFGSCLAASAALVTIFAPDLTRLAQWALSSP